MNGITTTNDVRQLRNRARKMGYVIKEGKDPYGCVGYMIIDAYTNTLEAGENYNMSLGDVEAFINE